MLCCFSCVKDEREPPGRHLDSAALARLIRDRTEALTNHILQGDLNQECVPDFIERRLLRTIIGLMFNIVVTILLQPPGSKL